MLQKTRKRFARLMAILLCFAMCFSALPAMAAEAPVESGTAQSEETGSPAAASDAEIELPVGISALADGDSSNPRTSGVEIPAPAEEPDQITAITFSSYIFQENDYRRTPGRDPYR